MGVHRKLSKAETETSSDGTEITWCANNACWIKLS